MKTKISKATVLRRVNEVIEISKQIQASEHPATLWRFALHAGPRQHFLFGRRRVLTKQEAEKKWSNTIFSKRIQFLVFASYPDLKELEGMKKMCELSLSSFVELDSKDWRLIDVEHWKEELKKIKHKLPSKNWWGND